MFDDRELIFTAETTPDLSMDLESSVNKIIPLVGLADAVNITDSPNCKTKLSSILVASEIKKKGLDVILQLTGRDRNRIAIESEIIGAASIDINKVLCLTGDQPGENGPKALGPFSPGWSPVKQRTLFISIEAAPIISDSMAILFLSLPVNCRITSSPFFLISDATRMLDSLVLQFGESVIFTASAKPTKGIILLTLLSKSIERSGVVSAVKINSLSSNISNLLVYFFLYHGTVSHIS